MIDYIIVSMLSKLIISHSWPFKNLQKSIFLA